MSNQFHILVVGLEHFIDKIGYQAYIYNYFNQKVTYLLSDNSNFSINKANKYNAQIIICKKNKLLRLLQNMIESSKKKYTHIDIYITGFSVFIVFLFTKFFNKNTLIILRGYEFDPKSFFYKSMLKYILQKSDKIVAKEPYLLKQTQKIVAKEKILFLPNCIKPYSGEILLFNERTIDILFLNTPRNDRNLKLLIDSVEILLKTKTGLHVVIAGFSILSKNANKINIIDQEENIKYIKQKKMNCDLELLPFVENPFDYHKRAKVFVLPGNFIFLNYSMLESMSCGAVPVVTKGDGWDLIFKPDINGLVTDFDVNQYAEALSKALDENIWEKISQNARNTVLENFSIQEWGRKILEFQNLL